MGSRAARRGSARRERVHAELPFAFTLDTGGGRSLLVNGIVDVHAAEEDGVLVVDYKSDRLEGREPGSRVEEAYATQRLVYALAALRSGAARAEVAYCFLERPDEPVAAVSPRRDVPALEDELLRARRRACPRAASSPRPRPTAASAPTAPGSPALCCWARSARWPSRPPASGERRPSGAVPSGAPPYLGGMPLCFIEPQEAIRVVAEAVGREARRQLLGEVVRAWVDEIPDDELAGALRQGRRGARRRRPVDARRLARVARGRASPWPTRSSCSAFARLGEHRREALRIAAGFRGEDAFEAGVSEEQALDTVLPWLSAERTMELAAEAVELYCWDRLGCEN